MLKNAAGISLAVLICTSVLMSGCGPRLQRREAICPGKANVQEALAALELNAARMTTLKAIGKAVFRYSLDGKERKPEAMTIRVWVDPPKFVYVEGSAPFVAKAVRLGMNEKEFYLAMRPSEISTYIWGEWEGNSPESAAVRACVDQRWLGPQSWFDALGAIGNEQASEWKLVREGPYDVLEKFNPSGLLIKKVYVFNCNYEIRKIQYFDAAGQVSSEAQFDNYIEVAGSNGWRIPSQMRFDTGRWDMNAQSLTATITSALKVEFTDQKRKLFFTRPAPDGFEHVEKIGPDCRAVEQR